MGNQQKKNRAEIEDEHAIIEAIKEVTNSERIRIKEKNEDYEKIRKYKVKREKDTNKVETMKKLFEKKEIVEEKKESKVKSISKMLEENFRKTKCQARKGGEGISDKKEHLYKLKELEAFDQHKVRQPTGR